MSKRNLRNTEWICASCVTGHVTSRLRDAVRSESILWKALEGTRQLMKCRRTWPDWSVAALNVRAIKSARNQHYKKSLQKFNCEGVIRLTGVDILQRYGDIRSRALILSVCSFYALFLSFRRSLVVKCSERAETRPAVTSYSMVLMQLLWVFYALHLQFTAAD